MKFKTLKWMGLALAMTLTTGHAADSEYWTEFEAKKIPLMQHIQNLSNVSEAAPTTVKNHTKNALAYFFATGGKYGFRKEPATATEYDVLVKALAVTTALHNASSALDLVQIRRDCGLTTEDERTQNHLIQAQAIMAHARWMPSYFDPDSAGFIVQLQNHTKNDYLVPLQKLSTKPSTENLKSTYLNLLTVPVVQAIVSVVSPTYDGEIDDNCLHDIKEVVDRNFPDQSGLSSHASITFRRCAHDSTSFNVQSGTENSASRHRPRSLNSFSNKTNSLRCLFHPSSSNQSTENGQDDDHETKSEPAEHDW
ncbi:hypothetical protein [Candidatus Finniella inopinata]|uniref:Uncharacterized protein n=1 Tax=Candidatus Finniella inopinata TaxID=1696036 RepID=A0A4Q7DL03_9PROT|nr:hypothetical protein [Candidatus Finniella inopinata]RZI47088.1 hypothetical protein EQU50_00435 [Candidatus Finniella inopinata]